MDALWDNITRIIGLTTMFIPVHQALLEVYKLTGAKQRRYWEALVYIVYGPKGRPTWADTVRIVPVSLDTLDQGSRNKWMNGPQVDLIQSFLLRAVGDSPVPDVSDADIRNVTEVARMSAPRPIQQLSRMLEQMTRAQLSVDTADALIASVPIEDGQTQPVEGFERPADWVALLREVVQRWRDALKAAREQAVKAGSPAIVNPAMVILWEEAFNERFLKGAVRARRELANALKSAEFRYHEVLFRWSTVLAVVEGVVIAWMTQQLFGKATAPFEWWHLWAVGGLAFAAMILGSRGSKSLLDAVIGIGTRLKG
ncbi:MAG: hypothetical protein ACRELZ_16635 [Candidatus Rokuibacteriota bacterium]